MAWTKLAPLTKTTGRPMASASIVVNKDNVPKISLILSASLKDEFGDPQRADVSAGEGEHEGSLLVEFTEAGAFPVKRFVHGGARIFVPVPAGVPDKPAMNEPCSLGEKIGAGNAVLADGQSPGVVIHLPVAAWKASIAERGTPSPRREPHPPPQHSSAGSAPKLGAGEPLDAVEYLTSKGVKISRLAAGRFAFDGDTVQLGQVLRMVNDLRAKADLDPLPAHKIR